jgi:hypothetical protein
VVGRVLGLTLASVVDNIEKEHLAGLLAKGGGGASGGRGDAARELAADILLAAPPHVVTKTLSILLGNLAPEDLAASLQSPLPIQRYCRAPPMDEPVRVLYRYFVRNPSDDQLGNNSGVLDLVELLGRGGLSEECRGMALEMLATFDGCHWNDHGPGRIADALATLVEVVATTSHIRSPAKVKDLLWRLSTKGCSLWSMRGMATAYARHPDVMGRAICEIAALRHADLCVRALVDNDLVEALMDLFFRGEHLSYSPLWTLSADGRVQDRFYEIFDDQPANYQRFCESITRGEQTRSLWTMRIWQRLMKGAKHPHLYGSECVFRYLINLIGNGVYAGDSLFREAVELVDNYTNYVQDTGIVAVLQERHSAVVPQLVALLEWRSLSAADLRMISSALRLLLWYTREAWGREAICAAGGVHKMLPADVSNDVTISFRVEFLAAMAAYGSYVDAVLDVYRARAWSHPHWPAIVVERLNSWQVEKRYQQRSAWEQEGVIFTERPDFLCPITQMKFVFPVVASDGNTYERAPIERVIRDGGMSPLTRQPLEDTLFDNHALRKLIEDDEEAAVRAHRTGKRARDDAAERAERLARRQAAKRAGK